MPHKQTKHRVKKSEDEKPAIKADPETLHTTDPQEHMKGPVSSMMHGIEETVEDTGSKAKPKQKHKK